MASHEHPNITPNHSRSLLHCCWCCCDYLALNSRQREYMKLCRCPDLHQDISELPINENGDRYCPACEHKTRYMQEPKPDAFQRWMHGNLIIHWRDGYVNLVDVSEPLKAKRIYTRKAS